jgi:predicted transcriptional regulator
MKNILTFEDYINESTGKLRVILTTKAAASMEKDLKANGVEFTKEKPTIFIMDDSPKARTAIMLVKQRFGMKSIIVK